MVGAGPCGPCTCQTQSAHATNTRHPHNFHRARPFLSCSGWLHMRYTRCHDMLSPRTAHHELYDEYQMPRE